MTLRTTTGALLAALCLAPLAAQAPGFPQCEVDGWKLSLQAWTFRNLTLLETIDTAKELGIEYLEAYPGQKIGGGRDEGFGPGCSAEGLKAVQDKLAETGVKLRLFGVTGIPGDEAGARGMFEWAKSVGLEQLNTEPDPAAMPMLDKLAKEFGIKVGIHNHPEPSRYWNPQTVVDACQGLSDMVGACGDTGHWSRSKVNTIDAVKLLGGQLVSFHLKDINATEKNAHDVVWGTGVSELEAVLRQAKAQGFEGYLSIEYEVLDDQLKDNVKACVAWFYETTAKLAAE